jgi:hypothetical protein
MLACILVTFHLKFHRMLGMYIDFLLISSSLLCTGLLIVGLVSSILLILHPQSQKYFLIYMQMLYSPVYQYLSSEFVTV